MTTRNRDPQPVAVADPATETRNRQPVAVIHCKTLSEARDVAQNFTKRGYRATVTTGTMPFTVIIDKQPAKPDYSAKMTESEHDAMWA
jgi:hypothetical protein